MEDTHSLRPQRSAPSQRAWDRRDWGAVVALAALWGLFFWRYFAPDPVDRVALPTGDFTDHFYVLRSFAFDQLRAGHFPLWGGQGVFSVYPFQADPESALFYPPAILNLLLWLVLGESRFPLAGFQLEALGHILLASLLTYLFLRIQVRKRAAAVLGSVAFSYSGYLIGYPLLQISFIEAAVWLPLALLGVYQLSETGRLRYAALTALAGALAFLPGNPQNFMFLAYTTLAYYLYRSWLLRTPWRVALARLALIGLLAFGLSAVQLLPSAQWWQLSTRADMPFEQAAGGFPPTDIVQLLLTGLVSWWQPLYVGLLTLALAGLAGLLSRRRDAPFWIALAIVALIFSLGKNVFGFEIAHLLLPGFSLFRDQERLAYLATFALSVLAAYGADVFLSPLARRERRVVAAMGRWLWRAVPLVFALLLLIIALSRLGIDPGDGKQTPARAAVLFISLASIGLAFYLRLYRRGSRRLWGALLLAILVFDLFSLNRTRLYAPYHDPHTVSPLWNQVLSDPGFFRVQEDVFPIVGDVAGRRQLRSVSGVAIRMADYQEFLDGAFEDVRWKLLGVKYLVSWRGNLLTWQERLAPGEKLLEEGEGAAAKALHRLAEPVRPAWIVHDVTTAADKGELYRQLNAPDFDPFGAAVTWEAVAVQPGDPAGDSAAITAFEPNRVALQARASAPGLLVLGEVMYPGWTVQVNGQPARLVTADGILRAVALPAGEAQVEFRFQPGLFYAGAVISALTVALLLGWGIWAVARRRQIAAAATCCAQDSAQTKEAIPCASANVSAARISLAPASGMTATSSPMPR